MTKEITFKKAVRYFLLLTSLAGSCLFNYSHAKIGDLFYSNSIIAKGTGSGSDTIAPVLFLNSKDTVYFEVFDTYIEYGARAVDNIEGDISSKIYLISNVNMSMIGIYYVTFYVKDTAGNSASIVKVVIINDTQKPVISNADANANNEIKVQILSNFVDRTMVTDNYDKPTLTVTNGSNGSVNSSFPGTFAISYNATDQSKNKADTKTYIYIVDDYIAPKINLNTLDTISWLVNKAFTPIAPSATDNYYSSTQISLISTNNVNPYKLGLYVEEYIATDGSGNVAVRRRWVRVVDNEAPMISGKPLNVLLLSSPDLSEGLSLTDNYDSPASLFPRLSTLFNNVNTSIVGLYTVTFRVSDLSGNYSLTFDRNIMVVDKLGMGKLDDEKTVDIYPNPSTGILNIHLNYVNTEDMEVEVYNCTGRLIAAGKGICKLDLGEEADGVYTFRIKTTDKIIVSKVSIAK